MVNPGNFSLVGGAPALDFANTAAGRDAAAPAEHLATPTDLVDWALHAGSIDAATAARARTELAGDRDLAETVFRHALQLREAVYRIGACLAHGHAPPGNDLTRVKDVARRALSSAELAPADGRYRFDFSAAPPEAALLGPIAWSALDLLAAGRFERLKQCANHDCGWLFLDHSKNNSRRWCDMATCGNVAKGRRHRQRRA